MSNRKNKKSEKNLKSRYNFSGIREWPAVRHLESVTAEPEDGWPCEGTVRRE